MIMKDRYELEKDHEEFYDECDKFRAAIKGILKFIIKQGLILLISALIFGVITYFTEYEIKKVFYIGGMISILFGMLPFFSMGAAMNKNRYDLAWDCDEPTGDKRFNIDLNLKKKLRGLIVLGINGLILMGISELMNGL